MDEKTEALAQEPARESPRIYMEIHLFPRPTGEHNTLWCTPDAQQVVLGRARAHLERFSIKHCSVWLHSTELD